MNRRELVVLSTLWMLGCERESPAPALRLRALLNAGRIFGESTEEDETAGFAELTRLAGLVRQRVGGGAAMAAKAQALKAVVFEQARFAREVTDPSVRFMFLPAVLRSRRGSCVGLATLYAGLAELLGWPLECVMRPGHVYVRLTQAEGYTNVELLRGGESMPDGWYEERWPIAGGRAPAYARALRDDELLGVIAYNVGKQRQRERRYPAARHAFELAVRRFPDFAEAHASLGALLQLIGSLDEAEAAYEQAHRVDPSLSGLEHNLQLLRAERDARNRPLRQVR